jgi:hypothetical protein
MKGAMILSRDSNFFCLFKNSVNKSNLECIAEDLSIKIFSNNKEYIILYNRNTDDGFFDELDIPHEARFFGYIYSFLIECRSEKFFCDIIGLKSLNLDMLILDANGNLYQPSELSPDKISL